MQSHAVVESKHVECKDGSGEEVFSVSWEVPVQPEPKAA